jgi:hypothetical protein
VRPCSQLTCSCPPVSTTTLGGSGGLRDVVTFHWEMLPAGADKVLVRGPEFLVIDDEGRILADYRFFPD